jgi:hypothetical protein
MYDQGNRITDAIRTNISFLKNEKLTLIIKDINGIKITNEDNMG